MNKEQPAHHPFHLRDWLALGAITILSILVRVVFYSGPSGSDDVQYVAKAAEICNGVFKSSSWVLSARYGMKLPIAMFMKIFGINEVSANIWSFSCSIAEVIAIFIFARMLWNLRAAIFSSLIMALLSLHVHIAGRLTVDSPNAFFITLSLLLFFLAEKNRDRVLYFLTGLSIGFTFWIREASLIYVVVFLFYILVFRNWKARWLWLILAATIMIVADGLILWKIENDPFLLFKIYSGSVRRAREGINVFNGAPFYYLYYMFIDIKHIWITCYLALGGLTVWARHIIKERKLDEMTYIVIWALATLLAFSFTVVSINPLKFIAKQTNYMLMFIAPWVLLAGYFLSRFKGVILGMLLTFFIVGATIFCGLEQQAIRIFTSNIKAAIIFAEKNKDIPIYGTGSAYNLSYLETIINPRRETNRIGELNKLPAQYFTEDGAGKPTAGDQKPIAYAIIDRETIDWGNSPAFLKNKIPQSWKNIGTLEPIGFGVGEKMLKALVAIFDRLPIPGNVKMKMMQYANPYLRPKPAQIYAIYKRNGYS